MIQAAAVAACEWYEDSLADGKLRDIYPAMSTFGQRVRRDLQLVLDDSMA